jgi:hypothetical protein
MIPKVIHYVWLGGAKPNTVVENIDSWHKKLPNYKFIEWNEKNWPIDELEFTKESYNNGKFAYVSDVIRLDVLNKVGGIYLDTDIQVHKDFAPLLKNNCFWGMMYNNALGTSVIGSTSNNNLIQNMLSMYKGLSFNEVNNSHYYNNNNAILTKFILKYNIGFKLENKIQVLDDNVIILPKEYFTFPTNNKKIDYSDHLFMNSWGSSDNLLKKYIKYFLKASLGNVIYGKISAQRGKRRYSFLEKM